jgi:SNF2 family DNA or RNA helicase
MYLKKSSDYLQILNINKEDISLIRFTRIHLSCQLVGDYYECLFSLQKLVEYVKYLESNNYEYELSIELVQLFDEINVIKNEFNYLSDQAQTIKNSQTLDTDEYNLFKAKISRLLVRKPYNHQLLSSFHLYKAKNACNFSVPGAGKTTIVYASYAALKSDGIVDKLLIVGPLSSYLAWNDEYLLCFGVLPDIMPLHAIGKSEKKEFLTKFNELQSEITFVNYESFNSIILEFENYFENNNVMIVIDEAHKIKNPNALRSRSILNVSNKAISRVALTGTPMPNGYTDLYNLFEFIWPGKNLTGFNLNQLKLLSKSPVEFKVNQLMANIDPFYVRIEKKHLGLPKPNFHEPIYVEMKPIQRQIYNLIVEDFLKTEFENYEDQETLYILKKAKLIRLMQTLSNPQSINLSNIYDEAEDGEKLSNLILGYEKLETPSKYEKTLEITKEIINRDEKVIIWCVFTHNINGLQRYLNSHGIGSQKLYGKSSNEERERIISEFHNDKNFKVIIANPAAVAESISLHKVCHNAIYFEKNFNAAHYMQSKDRIHRVGLKATDIINYYFIVTKNTIDLDIHHRVIEKENTMIEIIEGRFVPLFDSNFDLDYDENDLDYISRKLRENYAG